MKNNSSATKTFITYDVLVTGSGLPSQTKVRFNDPPNVVDVTLTALSYGKEYGLDNVCIYRYENGKGVAGHYAHYWDRDAQDFLNSFGESIER